MLRAPSPACSRSRSSPSSSALPPRARTSTTRWSAPMIEVSPLAQVVIHHRSENNLPCQAAQPSKLFCPDWALHHLDRYGTPALQHLVLVGASVALGFALAFALA